MEVYSRLPLRNTRGKFFKTLIRVWKHARILFFKFVDVPESQFWDLTFFEFFEFRKFKNSKNKGQFWLMFLLNFLNSGIQFWGFLKFFWSAYIFFDFFGLIFEFKRAKNHIFWIFRTSWNWANSQNSQKLKSPWGSRNSKNRGYIIFLNAKSSRNSKNKGIFQKLNSKNNGYFKSSNIQKNKT